MAPPLISIITSTFNCADELGRTADSIRQQTYKHIQWIVADGASTDGTLEVIKANSDVVSDWFSQRDTGIYDAWNKAVPYIKGDWVLFLGGGDLIAESQTLQHVADFLSTLSDDVGTFYGNVVQEFHGEVIYRYGRVDIGKCGGVRPGLPCHQGVFQRAHLFREGCFDTSYRIVADSKFMFETMQEGNVAYSDILVARMGAGGISSAPAGAMKTLLEFLRLSRDLGYEVRSLRKMDALVRASMKLLAVKFFGPGVAMKMNSLYAKLKLVFGRAFSGRSKA